MEYWECSDQVAAKKLVGIVSWDGRAGHGPAQASVESSWMRASDFSAVHGGLLGAPSPTIAPPLGSHGPGLPQSFENTCISTAGGMSRISIAASNKDLRWFIQYIVIINIYLNWFSISKYVYVIYIYDTCVCIDTRMCII